MTRWICVLFLCVMYADTCLGATHSDVDELKKAAAAGDAQALFRLGDMYEQGEQVEHNMPVAAAYMRLAAERDHRLAQYRLGLYSAGGIGISEDLAESFKWLSLAADAEGAEPEVLLAAALRDAVATRMSESDIDQARQQISAFSPVPGPAELPQVAALSGGEERTAPTLATIEQHLPTATCGPVKAVQDEGGRFRVTGYVPRGVESAQLSGTAATFFAEHAVDVELIGLHPTLCEVIELITAHPKKIDEDLAVILRDENGRSTDIFPNRSYLVIEFPGFEFPVYVSVDYFPQIGEVLHMLPNSADKRTFLPAGKKLVLGDPRLGINSWRVGPPFGRDLLVVFVSERPFYEGVRPDAETTESYIRLLRERLAGAPDDAIRIHYRIVRTVAGDGS